MQTIALENLLFMLVPVVAVGVIYFKWVGSTHEIGVATVRMVAQLLIIGYLLNYIFEIHSGWSGLLVGLAGIVIMIFASSWITMRSLSQKNTKAFQSVLLAITLGGSINLAFVIFLVMESGAAFQPQIVIPLAGMIYANAMNAVSLGAERFEKEFARTEDYLEARKVSYRAALIPQINTFLAVGLVSLPGMMTGQIIAGISPLIAVRYQIMVMSMILGTAGLAVAIYLKLQQPKTNL